MLVIINHKTNFLYENIKSYEKKLRKYDVIILPSACYLPLFKKGKYILGAQDISSYDDLVKTGEITGKELKSLNTSYVLIGHSERRIYNNETNDILKQKIKNAQNNNIIPLYCIGDENKDNFEALKNQIDLFIENYKGNIYYIIYEPIYNINNNNPDLSNIDNHIKYIKEYLQTKKIANYKIIYGGGVNKNNIEILKQNKNLDGIIISKVGLNIKDLDYIYKKAKY